MDELTMKGLTAPEDLFSRRKGGSSSPPSSPSIFMTNGNSLATELMKPLDLKNNIIISNEPPTTTWRPTHEYSKSVHIPTPFTIKDILGLGDEEASVIAKQEEEGEEGEEQTIVEEVEEEEEEEEGKIDTNEIIDDYSTRSPSPGFPTTPTTPSPQPMSMEMDEPLNLTVVKRENPDSPSSYGEETNNNRLVNGSGRLFMSNHSTSRDKSPNTGPLLPNDVIIPKVKHPKTSTAIALNKSGGAKSKGCGAINLKTSTKRKSKDRRGGPSPKMLAMTVDTGMSRSEEAVTPTPHNTSLLSPSLGGENGSSNDSKKRKKARTTFTGKQIYELERQFEIKKYLSSSERSEMARLLNVTEVQVKIWFQNRRTKWKKQDNISNAEAAEHKVMATKSPGSKKEKNSHHQSNKGAASSSSKKTSECSLSISGSIDSSDDHSNVSLSSHGGNTSEVSLTDKHINKTAIIPIITKSPGPSLSPESEEVPPRRGRSPVISIPRLLLSSPLWATPPIRQVVTTLQEMKEKEEAIMDQHNDHSQEEEETEEEGSSGNRMDIVEDEPPQPPSPPNLNILGSGSGGNATIIAGDLLASEEDDEEIIASVNNKDLETNPAHFSPVSQAS